jgi:DNA topoisomerase-1
MIVDREREIEGFIPHEYWSIDAQLEKMATKEGFTAALLGFMDKKKIDIGSREEADTIVSELNTASYAVAQVKKKQVARQPAPPFITSTLQQEGWRKLRFSAKRTMALAQQLYEGLPIGDEGSIGLITYMRTDSVMVATSALEETRAYIKEKYGANFLPPHARVFRKKAKGAQEAHEAIRPTSIWREPEAIRGFLTGDQFRLYELIWKRMVSSQISPALLDTIAVDIEAKREDGKKPYLLRATSSRMKFPGFTILYSEGKDEAEDETEKAALPELTEGDPLKLMGLTPEQHFTQPPNRYTEATLVKALEERGIGRPSTYAPILGTIQDRGYVEQDSRKFHPTELGCLVSDKLCQHFPDIVDYGFTAQMEEGLDQIAQGEREWVPYLKEFYDPFEKTLQAAKEQMEKVKIPDEATDEVCTECGEPMVIKVGRYGKFLACTGYPECKHTKPLLIKIGVKCPQCGSELVERQNRKKRTFYGCSGYPDCKFATNDRPIAQPCPECGELLVMRGKSAVKCTKCKFSGRLDELEREALKV